MDAGSQSSRVHRLLHNNSLRMERVILRRLDEGGDPWGCAMYICTWLFAQVVRWATYLDRVIEGGEGTDCYDLQITWCKMTGPCHSRRERERTKNAMMTSIGGKGRSHPKNDEQGLSSRRPSTDSASIPTISPPFLIRAQLPLRAGMYVVITSPPSHHSIGAA